MANGKLSRNQGIVSLAFAVLLALPLLATPGSAALLTGGGFEVESHNVESPEIRSVAGLSPSAELVAPPFESGSWLIRCQSPQDASLLYLNEAMMAHSNSNYAAFLAGDYSSMTADSNGWSVFVEYDGSGEIIGAAHGESGYEENSVRGYKKITGSDGAVTLRAYSCIGQSDR